MLSKPVSGDAAEQRLKTEVMQLPARDRRRLKDISDVCAALSVNRVQGRGCNIRITMADGNCSVTV